MSEWIIALEGTDAGHRLALGLALVAAFLHACFGALQKGRFDPWVARGGIDVAMAVLALPVALFLVPWPTPELWLLLAGASVIHVIYKIGMAQAYARGAFTVVYPVVRGTGPLVTVIAAYFIFGETFSGLQWLGVGFLLAGIFGLALYNLRTLEVDRATLVPALWLAVFTGLMTAIYTTYDAYGIRAAANPFTFLAWFFVFDGLSFQPIFWRHLRKLPDWPEVRPLAQRSILGAFIAFGSFGSIMLATRLDKVGEAAVLRETSTVFAAVIGWLILKETVGPRRLSLMALIALGAVTVEIGG